LKVFIATSIDVVVFGLGSPFPGAYRQGCISG